MRNQVALKYYESDPKSQYISFIQLGANRQLNLFLTTQRTRKNLCRRPNASKKTQKDPRLIYPQLVIFKKIKVSK